MKTITTNFLTRKDKVLFLKVVLLSTLTVGVYSNFKRSKGRIQPIKISQVHNDQYGDFDKAQVPNRPPVISKMISVLNPGLSVAQRQNVAVKIHQALGKYKIAPQIVVAIIDAESSFNQNLVSSSGDLSLAQVNVEVWNKEFLRMNLEVIDVEKLKSDETYSLEVMTKILHILKTRYEKKDRRWYARYHSKTKKYRRAYLAKIEARMKLLESSNIVAKKEAKQQLIALQ